MSFRCVTLFAFVFIHIIHLNNEILAKDLGFANKNVTMCGNLKCIHSSLCFDDQKKCSCNRGYTGQHCELDIDECEFGNPCYHRGYCSNTFGSYDCNCLTGWKNGINQHCEIKVIQDEHSRKCVPGWMGDMCQHQCLNSSMCEQNQECKKHGRGNLCLCKTGFSKVCKTNEPDCKRYKKDSFTCECPAGWTGPICTDDVNECLQNQCKNSAVCTNSNGSYSCVCMEGWTGKDCDEDVDECASQPCNASLICHNKQGSFSCDAPSIKRVDLGGIGIQKITVMSLGILLFLLLLICLVITLKKKCKEKSGKQRKVAAGLPKKRIIPSRDFAAHPVAREGFVYKNEKPSVQRQVLDF